MAETYVPLVDFKTHDSDRNSRRIRDMPYGKVALKGNLTPLDINFGLVPRLSTSASQNIILVNQGYDKLVINSIVAVGDFVINNSLPAVIEPEAMHSLSVAFLPRREGIVTGGISVDLGNAQGKHFAILRGTGTAQQTIPGENGGETVMEVKLSTLTEVNKRDYVLSSLVPAGKPDQVMLFVGGSIQRPAVDYTILNNGGNNLLRFTGNITIAGLEILAIGTKLLEQ